MKTKIIDQTEWKAVQVKWEADAQAFSDDLSYLPSIHEQYGEILLVSDDKDYPLMVTNLVVVQLPGMMGKTLRSTRSAFAPKFEFDTVDEAEMYHMYATAVLFTYRKSIDKGCNNIKVYTPRSSDMKMWYAFLKTLVDVENIDRTVQYQGRWTALVKKHINKGAKHG